MVSGAEKLCLAEEGSEEEAAYLAEVESEEEVVCSVEEEFGEEVVSAEVSLVLVQCIFGSRIQIR